MASDEADDPLQKAKKQRSEEETVKRFLERVTQKAKENEEQREREREEQQRRATERDIRGREEQRTETKVPTLTSANTIKTMTRVIGQISGCTH